MAIPELIVRSITIAALIAAGILAFTYITQRSLVYFPGATSPGRKLLPAGAPRG